LKGTRDGILSASAKSPLFIQYGYADIEEMLQEHFNEVRVKKVLKNIPPARVYVCTNKS